MHKSLDRTSRFFYQPQRLQFLFCFRKSGSKKMFVFPLSINCSILLLSCVLLIVRFEPRNCNRTLSWVTVVKAISLNPFAQQSMVDSSGLMKNRGIAMPSQVFLSAQNNIAEDRVNWCSPLVCLLYNFYLSIASRLSCNARHGSHGDSTIEPMESLSQSLVQAQEVHLL